MVDIYDCVDHIAFIKNSIDFKLSKKSRPQSLRSLAKKIEISPAYLSKILSKKQSLSTDASLKILQWLELSQTEIDFFLLLLKLSQEKNLEKKKKLQTKIDALKQSKKRKSFDPNIFEQIAGVNYITTFLLMAGKYKTIDASELTKIIPVDLKTAKDILETLERCQLAVKVKNKYQRTDFAGRVFESSISNTFLRTVYKEMLLFAINAVDSVPMENRTIGCESFLIDKEQIPKVQQHIEDCFTKVVNLSNEAKTKDHVYNLGIQLVKLTKDQV